VKIAIFGAGAIGGLLGAKLADVGADVTFISRGAHLAAMQANGVTLLSGDAKLTVRPRCLADQQQRESRTLSSSRSRHIRYLRPRRRSQR
jgi:2-dehydropantoate 2-reductase